MTGVYKYRMTWSTPKPYVGGDVTREAKKVKKLVEKYASNVTIGHNVDYSDTEMISWVYLECTSQDMAEAACRWAAIAQGKSMRMDLLEEPAKPSVKVQATVTWERKQLLQRFRTAISRLFA